MTAIKMTTGVGILLIFIASCEKWKDNPGDAGDLLTTPYCNDPNAVNYNWDFPGIADNSVCFYPSNLFEGNFSFTDSVYFSDYTLDSAATQTYQITVTALDTVNIKVSGICGNSSSTITLTANKQYTASVDSNYYNGQLYCSNTDTVSGTFIRSRFDTTSNFTINFTVFGSNSEIKYHQGKAIKL